MKILVNISAISKQHRGMGIFANSILTELLSLSDYDYILVSCCPIDKNLYDLIMEKKIEFRMIKSPLPIFEQLIIPILVFKYKPDICWFPSNTFPLFKATKAKFIVTIHDLIFFNKNLYPKNIYQKIGQLYRSFNLNCGIKNIDVITSVSFSSLKDIYDYFKIDEFPKPTQVLYNSIDYKATTDDSILDELHIRDKKYIYSISGTTPNKNLPFLIKSFRFFSCNYPDYTLVITGASSEIINSEDTIKYTSFISEDKKRSLIKNSSLFVFASLEEGFGIPLIEGMSLTNRILASNIPVFNEIGQTYISYFDNSNEEFLIDYFKKMHESTVSIDEVILYLKAKFDAYKTTQNIISLFYE